MLKFSSIYTNVFTCNNFHEASLPTITSDDQVDEIQKNTSYFGVEFKDSLPKNYSVLSAPLIPHLLFKTQTPTIYWNRKDKSTRLRLPSNTVFVNNEDLYQLDYPHINVYTNGHESSLSAEKLELTQDQLTSLLATNDFKILKTNYKPNSSCKTFSIFVPNLDSTLKNLEQINQTISKKGLIAVWVSNGYYYNRGHISNDVKIYKLQEIAHPNVKKNFKLPLNSNSVLPVSVFAVTKDYILADQISIIQPCTINGMELPTGNYSMDSHKPSYVFSHKHLLRSNNRFGVIHKSALSEQEFKEACEFIGEDPSQTDYLLKFNYSYRVQHPVADSFDPSKVTKIFSLEHNNHVCMCDSKYYKNNFMHPKDVKQKSKADVLPAKGVDIVLCTKNKKIIKRITHYFKTNIISDVFKNKTAFIKNLLPPEAPFPTLWETASEEDLRAYAEIQHKLKTKDILPTSDVDLGALEPLGYEIREWLKKHPTHSHTLNGKGYSDTFYHSKFKLENVLEHPEFPALIQSITSTSMHLTFTDFLTLYQALTSCEQLKHAIIDGLVSNGSSFHEIINLLPME